MMGSFYNNEETCLTMKLAFGFKRLSLYLVKTGHNYFLYQTNKSCWKYFTNLTFSL